MNSPLHKKISQPTKLPITNIKKIYAGEFHSFALTRSEMWAWGNNKKGNLGFITSRDSLPVPTLIQQQFDNIATGLNHSFGWTDTEVYGWGSNQNYQLGLKQCKVYPITRLDDFKQAYDNQFKAMDFACGQSHSLSVVDIQSKSKRLFVWGNSNEHQLIVDSNLVIPYPIVCQQFKQEVDKVYSRSTYNIALCDGSIYSWGSEMFGRLGMEGPSRNQKIPKRINVSKVASIALGLYHVVAILTSGEMYGWGQALHGQLGIGKLVHQVGPTKIPFEGSVVQASCGQNFSLFLTQKGQVYSCGSGQNGCLGYDQFDDSKKRSLTPRKIKLESVKAIATGKQHCLAVNSSGEVYSWGDNSRDQLGIPSLSQGIPPLPINSNQSGDLRILADSETSIYLPMNPSPRLRQLSQRFYHDDQSIDRGSIQKQRRLRDWHSRYKQFLDRKARQQRELMAELQELLHR